MRVQASKISVAALGLLAPCAFAHTAHLARHAAAPHKSAHVLERRHAAAPSVSHVSLKSGAHAGGKAHRHIAAASAETAKVKPEAPTADTVPEVETAESPVHVHHDRKVHLTQDSGQASDAKDDAETPHKASAEEAVSAGKANGKATIAPGEQYPVKLSVNNPHSSVTVHATKIVVKAPVEEIIPTRVIMPALYTKRGRLIIPPALKGSHEILIHQNTMADREGLDRVQDDEDLEQMRRSKMLVAIPASNAIEVDERLPGNRRYCRTWTAQFLAALGRAHYQRFHSALQVNSAVRTVEFQQRLIRTNGNAAPAEGSTASPHLTGQAVDLAKHGLSMTEIAWLRGYLLPLVQQGKVDVEEEFQQSCFHISVYRKYLPQETPKRTIDRHRSATTALAAAVR